MYVINCIQIYEFHEYRNVAILNSSMIPDWNFRFFQQKYVPPVCVFVFRWTSWTFDVQCFQLRTAFQMRHSSNKETNFSLRTALTGSGDSWLMVCVCVCVFSWNLLGTAMLQNGWMSAAPVSPVFSCHPMVGLRKVWQLYMLGQKTQEWSQIQRKGTPDEFSYSGIL